MQLCAPVRKSADGSTMFVAEHLLTQGPEMTDWSQIVAEHGTLVWRTARRLLTQEADAADCCQRTFLAAVELARREAVRYGRRSCSGWQPRGHWSSCENDCGSVRDLRRISPLTGRLIKERLVRTRRRRSVNWRTICERRCQKSSRGRRRCFVWCAWMSELCRSRRATRGYGQ